MHPQVLDKLALHFENVFHENIFSLVHNHFFFSSDIPKLNEFAIESTMGC